MQKTPSLSSGMVQKTPGVGSGRLKKTPWARVQKTPAEVDSNLEVHITPEVQLRFRTMETAVLPIATAKPENQSKTDAAGAAALWREILRTAQQRINPHSFSTWFHPTRGESLEGDRLRVRVPTRLFSRRLSETYGADLREACAQVGKPNLALDFVHAEGDARQ